VLRAQQADRVLQEAKAHRALRVQQDLQGIHREEMTHLDAGQYVERPHHLLVIEEISDHHLHQL
jgi:hypothetical protein